MGTGAHKIMSVKWARVPSVLMHSLIYWCRSAILIPAVPDRGLLPDSSVRGGGWQWIRDFGVAKPFSEYCYRCCRISWRSCQPTHWEYKPDRCPKSQTQNKVHNWPGRRVGDLATWRKRPSLYECLNYPTTSSELYTSSLLLPRFWTGYPRGVEESLRECVRSRLKSCPELLLTWRKWPWRPPRLQTHGNSRPFLVRLRDPPVCQCWQCAENCQSQLPPPGCVQPETAPRQAHYREELNLLMYIIK